MIDFDFLFREFLSKNMTNETKEEDVFLLYSKWCKTYESTLDSSPFEYLNKFSDKELCELLLCYSKSSEPPIVLADIIVDRDCVQLSDYLKQATYDMQRFAIIDLLDRKNNNDYKAYLELFPIDHKALYEKVMTILCENAREIENLILLKYKEMESMEDNDKKLQMKDDLLEILSNIRNSPEVFSIIVSEFDKGYNIITLSNYLAKLRNKEAIQVLRNKQKFCDYRESIEINNAILILETVAIEQELKNKNINKS